MKNKNVFILSVPYKKELREKPPSHIPKPLNLEEKLKKPYYDVILIEEPDETEDFE
jgi:hypothetical protein